MVSRRVCYGRRFPDAITSRARVVGASLSSTRYRTPAGAYESRAVAEIYLLEEKFDFFRVGQRALGPLALPVPHPDGGQRDDGDLAGQNRHVVRPHRLAEGD